MIVLSAAVVSTRVQRPDKKEPNEEVIIATNFYLAKTDSALNKIALNTHNVNVPMNNTHHQIIVKTKRKGGSERASIYTDLFVPSFRVCVSPLFFIIFFVLFTIPFHLHLFIHCKKVTWRANTTMMIIYYRIILLINIFLSLTELGFCILFPSYSFARYIIFRP